jgi:hypothetical protein
MRVGVGHAPWRAGHHLFRSLVGPNPIQLHTWQPAWIPLYLRTALANLILVLDLAIRLKIQELMWKAIKFVEQIISPCRKAWSIRLRATNQQHRMLAASIRRKYLVSSGQQRRH